RPPPPAPPAVRDCESPETDQQIRERRDVRTFAAARAFEDSGRLDATDHPERVVMRHRRHFGDRILHDFDEYAAESEAYRGPEQRIIDDSGIGFGDTPDHRLDQHGGLEAGVARILHDLAIGLAHIALARAAESHAAEVA